LDYWIKLDTLDDLYLNESRTLWGPLNKKRKRERKEKAQCWIALFVSLSLSRTLTRGKKGDVLLSLCCHWHLPFSFSKIPHRCLSRLRCSWLEIISADVCQDWCDHRWRWSQPFSRRTWIHLPRA